MKRTGRRDLMIYISFLLLFIFLIYVSLSPVCWKNEIKAFTEGDSAYVSNFNKDLNHAGLQEKVHTQAYYSSLLKLSESDSIQLAINLHDSTISLFLKGVQIHESGISGIRRHRMLDGLSALEYMKLFSQPLREQGQHATIVKEPVVVRHAPKDTAEAALTAWEPDTLIQRPAFLAISLEHQIDLIFMQDKTESFKGRIVRGVFFSKLFLRREAGYLAHFITFRKPDYHPRIRIVLPADDLRAIYRAIPENGRVALAL